MSHKKTLKVRLLADDAASDFENNSANAQCVKDLQATFRQGYLENAKTMAEATPLTYDDTASDYETGALRLYYAVKVLLVVINDTNDFSFVTGKLYKAI